MILRLDRTEKVPEVTPAHRSCCAPVRAYEEMQRREGAKVFYLQNWPGINQLRSECSPSRTKGREWKQCTRSAQNGGTSHPSPSIPLPVEGRGRSIADAIRRINALTTTNFPTQQVQELPNNPRPQARQLRSGCSPSPLNGEKAGMRGEKSTRAPTQLKDGT